MGEIPAHVEYYAGPEEVAEEDSWIVQALSKNGIAVLNRDDPAVWEMRELTKARVLSFGFAGEAHTRIAEYRVDFPDGISLKLFADGSFVPIRIQGCLGKPHAYAAAAAAAVGLAMDLNLVEIANALLSYQSPPGRMKLLRGIKDTWIIDDTYNASPIAMHAGLETLGVLSAKQKIVALGAMAEIGKFTRQAHEAVGFLAAEIADIIITVGDTAKIIGESAKSKNFPAKSLLHFDSAKEAGKYLQQIIVPGDVVLVKGSRALKMEQVVEEIIANPSIR
jgi:UDP-N-acetylmuramoyl-tripeptide--D-alanyl-D-alanine ligase